MNTTSKTIALAVLLGGATAAAAQTPSAIATFGASLATPKPTRAQTFASQLQQFQTLSSSTSGTYTFRPAPILSSKAEDPAGNESFAQRFTDLQATSSNDSNAFQQTRPTFHALAADPQPRDEPFAQRFAEMQAVSSNSGEFASPRGYGASANEADSTLVVARPIAHQPDAPVVTSHK